MKLRRFVDSEKHYSDLRLLQYRIRSSSTAYLANHICDLLASYITSTGSQLFASFPPAIHFSFGCHNSLVNHQISLAFGFQHLIGYLFGVLTPVATVRIIGAVAWETKAPSFGNPLNERPIYEVLAISLFMKHIWAESLVSVVPDCSG